MSQFSFKEAAKKNKNLKYGGYMTIVILFALIAFVLVNVLFQQLKINIDLTTEKLYTIGAKTQVLLDGVQDNVTIYGLYVSGNENLDAEAVINDYVNHCAKLTYRRVDPYANPDFTSRFKEDADTIATMSLIVVNETTGKYKVVANNDLYEKSQDFDYQTYQYKTTLTAFKAEEALTGAIQYVVSETTPTVYTLTGHGEAQMSSDVVSMLNKANYDFMDLNLLTQQIEANGNTILMINNPVQDLSDVEYDALVAYMDNGGRTIVTVSAAYPKDSMANFDRFLDRYGIEVLGGTLIETNVDYYMSRQYFLVPDVAETDITPNVPDKSVLVAVPAALRIKPEHNAAYTVEEVLSTSSAAVVKKNADSEVLDYEEGDEQGKFSLAVMARSTEIRNGVNVYPKLAVFGSYYMFDNTSGTMTSGNYNLLSDTLDAFQDSYDSIYISPKEYVSDTVTTTMTSAIVGGVVFILVIPITLLVIGIVIWSKRKRL